MPGNDHWRDRLRAGGIVLIDGGTGTELERRGVAMHETAWSAFASLTHHALLRSIHEDYVRAGAEVITANTFAGTRFVLEAAGAGERFREINTRAIDAALRARDAAGDGAVAIAASLSCLPPRFDTAAYPGEAAERAAYRELAALCAGNGADLILLEMMEEPLHARRAAEAAFETGLPVWLGLSCRLDDSRRSLVGYDFPAIPLAETVNALLDCEPALVAVMHSPPDAVAPALAELLGRWSCPLGAWPELADFTGHRQRVDARLSPDDFARAAADWVSAGARVLGGCCGTTPEHIRALQRALPDLLAIRAPRTPRGGPQPAG